MSTYSVNFSAGGDNIIKLNTTNLNPVFGGSISETLVNAKLNLSIAASATNEYSIAGDTVHLYVHECKDIIDHEGITTSGYQELVDTDSVDNSVVYFVKN